MKFLQALVNFTKRISRGSSKLLLSCVVIGFLVTFLISGKSSITLESIAVSQDEHYIACFERGNTRTIKCFSSDGSLKYDFKIPLDISAGGHCTLWFEDDVLCALFYRTDTKVSLSRNGEILEIVKYSTKESPPEFDSFSVKDSKFVFEGNEIDVLYDKKTFWEYWFVGSERYLAVIPKSGKTIILYAWTAKDGTVEVTDTAHLVN